MQGPREALEVEWVHSNEAATRAIHVGYESERDRHDQWQNDKFPGSFLEGASRIVADDEITADGNRRHQTPGRSRNAIPPRCLRISLRVQHVVHTRNGKR